MRITIATVLLLTTAPALAQSPPPWAGLLPIAGPSARSAPPQQEYVPQRSAPPYVLPPALYALPPPVVYGPPGVLVIPWSGQLPAGTTSFNVGLGGPRQDIECRQYGGGLWRCETADMNNNSWRPGW